MDTNLPRTDSAVSARRRLIKGGFAVPAALTLASGSALARTSSGCLARDANAFATPVFDSANATWIRVLAFTYQKDNTSARTYWVRHAEVDALATLAGVAIKGFWLQSGSALCVEGGPMPSGNSPYVAGTIYSSLPTLISSDASSLPSNTVRYYAVLVDAAGDIVGISQRFNSSATSGGAVHQSCWTSFALSK